jgi:hypothetical protein
MIPFSLIRPFLFAIAIAAAVGGAWLWHSGAVSDAFDAGKAEVQNRWEEADRLAVAVGDAKTKLLARNAIIQTETFHAKFETLNTAAARRGVALAERSAHADGLQQRLDALAATPPSSDPARASCRSDEERVRSCEGLVAEGVRVATEADRVATEARRLLEVSEVKLEALREWARLVQSAQEAP